MVGLVVALLPRHLRVVVVLHHEHLSESDARHKSAYAHERLHTEEPEENHKSGTNRRVAHSAAPHILGRLLAERFQFVGERFALLHSHLSQAHAVVVAAHEVAYDEQNDNDRRKEAQQHRHENAHYKEELYDPSGQTVVEREQFVATDRGIVVERGSTVIEADTKIQKM